MYHLIVVDDDSDILDLLRLVIGAVKEWSVKYVSSAEEALELCRECAVLTILTDIQMPGMKGDELVSKIREPNPEMPVFAMTGGAEGRLLDVQFEHVFHKPFDIRDLLERLTVVIERQAEGCVAVVAP